jgi:hypothetical protein
MSLISSSAAQQRRIESAYYGAETGIKEEKTPPDRVQLLPRAD